MQLKTILNRVQKFKSFVYTGVRWAGGGDTPELELEVEVAERANGRARCSGCGGPGPGYDRLAARRFEFVPLWGIPVFLVYAPRRVECPRCGVRVEAMPWASGKSHLTQAYAWFLARWARRLSWKEVAQVFRTSWDSVFRAVEMAVEWGRAHQDLGGVQAIGIDEITWKKGHRYLTLVYQIDQHCKRLLWVGENRRVRTLLKFFRWFGTQRSGELRYICSDMWNKGARVPGPVQPVGAESQSDLCLPPREGLSKAPGVVSQCGFGGVGSGGRIGGGAVGGERIRWGPSGR